MKDADMYSLGVGLVASVLKGIKKKLKIRPLIIAGITGALLSYGTLGALEFFMADVSLRTAILSAFIVGWVANEITEVLDDLVKDLYDIFLFWIRSRFNGDKDDESKDN